MTGLLSPLTSEKANSADQESDQLWDRHFVNEAQGDDNLCRLGHYPRENKHASAMMVDIVWDNTADLVEKSLSHTEHMSYIQRQDLATDKQEIQESNVRAAPRRSSPVLTAFL